MYDNSVFVPFRCQNIKYSTFSLSDAIKGWEVKFQFVNQRQVEGLDFVDFRKLKWKRGAQRMEITEFKWAHTWTANHCTPTLALQVFLSTLER